MSPTHLERRLQDDGSSSLWAVGVVLVLAGSVGNNLGNALVALAHKQATQQQLLNEQHEHDGAVAALETGGDRSPRQQPPPSPSLHTQRHERCSLRTIGTIVFVVGSLLTFAAFGFAAQSLLASLESIQFVSNVVFMRYVHKEAISWRILVSTAAIVAGNVLVVIFSNHTAALLTSADLIHLYVTNVSYWGYLVCAMVLWFINHLAYSHYYHARVARGVMLWKHSFVEPFTFAVSSAIIGTQVQCVRRDAARALFACVLFDRPPSCVPLAPGGAQLQMHVDADPSHQPRHRQRVRAAAHLVDPRHVDHPRRVLAAAAGRGTGHVPAHVHHPRDAGIHDAVAPAVAPAARPLHTSHPP